MTSTDPNAQLRSNTPSDKPATARSTSGTGSTSGTTAPSGANPAFDNQEKVNGQPVPNSPDAKTSMNDATSTGVANDHASTTGKTNSTRAAAKAKAKAHAQDTHAAAKYTAAHSKTGADKTDAQNADQHRTDEPFRDDVGRVPGANPQTPAVK